MFPRTRSGVLIGCVFGLLLLAALSNHWSVVAQQKQTQRLAGARPEVSAIDYPSLQAALDALPPTGGVVRFPAGRFEITQPLVLTTQDVLLVGAGTATQIHNLNDNGQPALILKHPQGQDVASKDRLWRVQLANFRITGNEKSGHGIEAIQIEEIYLEGLSVSQHGGDGIRLDHCYEDPRVANCLITYNKAVGLRLLGCHDIVVCGNQFEENQDALHCIDSFNLCMTGNNLDDHLGHGVLIENTYGSVVSGNMIEECNGTAIILDRDCYGNTLSANVIAHNGSGIDLRDAHGCAVSANTFTIMQTDALRIGPHSGRITVTGNNFSDSYIGDASVRRRKNDLAAAGLVLESTADVAISGNLFSSVRPKALELRGAPSRHVVFTSNVLSDVDSDHGQLQNSLTDGNLTHAVDP